MKLSGLKPGDEFRLGCVIAVHAQEGRDVRGVVLTYSADYRYKVWVVGDDLHVFDSDQFPTGTHAYFRYGERVTQQIFRYHNEKAPGLSYMVENKG